MSRKMIKANKLVRDKIPEIIEKDGGKPVYFSIFGYIFRKALFDKMREELNELKQSKDSNNSLEELADIYEVFLSIVKAHCYSIQDVINAADIKRKEKGGFESHFFLKQYIKNIDTSDGGVKEINQIFNNEKELKEYKSDRWL